MKILLLTPQPPYPPHQGTTIRNFNLIRQLATHHTIDLLTFLPPGHSIEDDSPLHQLCRRVGSAPQPVRTTRVRGRDTITSPLPDMALRLESSEMRRLVVEWTAEETYDIVQSEGIEMAQYGQMVRERRPDDARRPAFVFDDHNCEYLLQKRNALTDLRQPKRWVAAAYSLVQWRKLQCYEARLCTDADAVTVVSEADGEALRALIPDLKITVISNGIDLNLYAMAPLPDLTESPALVFTGKMDYRPNIDAALWFGREVLPLVTEQVPSARFQIVGMNPHPRLDELRANPNIEITGAVDDVRPYIARAAVYVIPMRVGGGTRFKALEAMASGKAIVSTRLGVEGIPVEDGRELLLADTPEETAAAILRLLRDDGSLHTRLGHAARAFVEARYGWEQIVPRLEEVYEQLGAT